MKSDLLAILAMIAVQIMGLFLFVSEHRRRKEFILREKCELLANYIAEIGLWFSKLSLCYVLDDLKKTPPPLESAKSVLLTSLYFPELEEAAMEYNKAIVQYHCYLVDFAPMVQGPASIIGYSIKHDRQGFDNWNRQLDLARKNLLAGMRRRGVTLL